MSCGKWRVNFYFPQFTFFERKAINQIHSFIYGIINEIMNCNSKEDEVINKIKEEKIKFGIMELKVMKKM